MISLFESPGSLPSTVAPQPVRAESFGDSIYLQRVLLHLKQSRETRGMSVTTVARRAGLKQAFVIAAERHEIIPDSKELRRWAAALGLTAEDLWSAPLADVAA